jgi:superfamily II DNA or RNA helicase
MGDAMSAPRIVPLDYQLTAALAMRDALSNPAAKPLAVIPTGGGKSVVIAALSQSILNDDPRLKILAVARSRVIQKHNRAALAAVAPDVPRAEFIGGPLAPGVTFATAQKLYKSPISSAPPTCSSSTKPIKHLVRT